MKQGSGFHEDKEFLYAMLRPMAWRGGSNAKQSCAPATALQETMEKKVSHLKGCIRQTMFLCLK